MHGWERSATLTRRSFVLFIPARHQTPAAHETFENPGAEKGPDGRIASVNNHVPGVSQLLLSPGFRPLDSSLSIISCRELQQKRETQMAVVTTRASKILSTEDFSCADQGSMWTTTLLIMFQIKPVFRAHSCHLVVHVPQVAIPFHRRVQPLVGL